MSMAADDVFAAAVALSPEDRLRIATQLLDTLDPANDEIDSAWREEIEARVREYEAGRVQAIPSEDVMAELRKDLAEGRLK